MDAQGSCTAYSGDGGRSTQGAGSRAAPAPCDSTCQGQNAGRGFVCASFHAAGVPACTGPPGVDIAALAQQAEATLPLPPPAVTLSPNPPVRQKVGLPMWVWQSQAQWQALSATAAAGPVSATVAAQPLQLIIDPGTGDPPVVCNGPGAVYDYGRPDETQHSDCTYTFPRSSARQPNLEFVVRVAIGFHVAWTSQGAPGGGDFGIVRGPAQTIPVQVEEIQIVNGR